MTRDQPCSAFSANAATIMTAVRALCGRSRRLVELATSRIRSSLPPAGFGSAVNLFPSPE